MLSVSVLVSSAALIFSVISDMARSWLIDGRSIANKVKNASLPAAHQIKDSGACRECPHCKTLINNSDVSEEWPGLPAGVKFDPSDEDLIEHLAAKCGAGNSIPHLFLDEFIPTLKMDGGICYTHPQNLPGAKKDGSSVHFFHRTSNAYATGQRKRRKIQSEHGLTTEQVRWHKTGKTKPVMVNGVQRGCRKIMVLYRSAKKGCKPDKSNWVMHQYHLGAEEDEEDGDYVVSKIFYQLKKHSVNNDSSVTSPMTPNIMNPPRRGEAVFLEDEDNEIQSSPKWLAGESQAAEEFDLDGMDDTFPRKELFDSSGVARNANDSINITCGIDDLVNLELDTPPDFQLADLQFLSQDSLFDWIDHL